MKQANCTRGLAAVQRCWRLSAVSRAADSRSRRNVSTKLFLTRGDSGHNQGVQKIAGAYDQVWTEHPCAERTGGEARRGLGPQHDASGLCFQLVAIR